MTDNLAIADKLDEARALIEQGWCQEVLHAGKCYCAVGAIRFAVNGDFHGTTASMEARTYLERAAGTSSLVDWNDAPERTQAEVIEAFRRAAELARAA